MQINISDPNYQTNIFIIFFALLTLLSVKKDKNRHEMLHSHTNELKGVAVLMVLFCHIGYFISHSTDFLFPLSVDGGVGVNIFLFLSGFGVTASMLKNKVSPFTFYKKRLPVIYIPMWIVVTVFVALDFLVLNKTYSLSLLAKNYLGFFPRADIFTDLNSPLWYFTWIVFYYLLFPWLFSKNKPYLSAIALYLVSIFLLRYRLPVVEDVQKLYLLHTLAFPLGMLFAWAIKVKPLLEIKDAFYALRESQKKVLYFGRYVVMAILLALFSYTSIKSGVGKTVTTEQLISIVTTITTLLFFYLKRYRSEILVILGVYSYEIYLIQWPLMYRFDVIYKIMPAGLGTVVYLGVLLALGVLLNKLTKKLLLSTDKKHNVAAS